MRILLVTYHYPPDRAVGGRRAEKVAESLRAAGHEVAVVTAGEGAGNGEVHRVMPLPSFRDVYAGLRRRFLGSGDQRDGGTTEDPGDATTPGGEAPRVPFWKRWIYSLIWLPDAKQGFIPRAIRRAMRLSDSPDLLYTTSPPHSVHLAGLILKVLMGIPWVAEFRDPWTANPWKPDYMKSAFSNWLDATLERLCLETADLLIPVSGGIESRLKETGTNTPILIIRNGIEHLRISDDPAADTHSDGHFEIVYAGTFYHARDPFPFLKAVGTLVRGEADEAAKLSVRFIGGTDHYGGRSILKFLRDSDLENHVQLEGWMEPERALHRVQTADALLLLAINQPDQVPNKLYEYLGARRPILAVADKHGESSRMLNQVGGHVLVPVNERRSIHAALKRILAEGRRRTVGDLRVLENWTTERQMTRLLAALEDVVGR